MPVTCPDPAELLQWLNGRLDADLHHRVSEHLEKCQICNEVLDSCEADSPSDTLAQQLRQLQPETDASLADTKSLPGTSSLPTPIRGTSIGSYQVLRTLGAGGMGEVRLARDQRLGRLVALKSPRFADQHLRLRFVQEAKAASKLRHPYICSVFDVFEHEQTPYIVLEYIDGCTLDTWVVQSRNIPEIITVMAKIARAVSFAHQNGVIHRDLKPSNILVDKNGDPHLMDFGLAKILEADTGDLTLSQQILGTPTYMAPEQARGDNSAVDARSDIYTLGTILYRLLAGRAPFDGENLLHKIQNDPPEPLRQIVASLPIDLDTICQKALAKIPVDRYASAQLLAEDCELWLAGEPIRARRMGWIDHTVRALSRNRRSIAVATCGALIIGLLAWGLAYQSHTARLRGRIEQQLVEPMDSWNSRASVEQELGSLRQLDQVSAAALSSRWTASIRQMVTEQLTQSRLSPESTTLVREQITWIAEKSGSKEDDLWDAFHARASRWKPLLRITVPIADKSLLPTESHNNIVATREGLLTRKSGEPVALANINNANGDLEVEAHFRAATNQTSTDRRDRYIMQLLSDGRRPIQFVCEQGPSGITLSIVSDNETLRSKEFDTSATQGVNILRVATESGAYIFVLNGRHQLRFFPLAVSRSNQLTISCSWPRSSLLTSMAINEAQTPTKPSLLQQGDDFYLQTKWLEARSCYEGVMTDVATTEITREARFKRGMCEFQLQRWEEAASDLEEVALAEENLFRASALCHAWYARRRLDDYERAGALYDRLATSVSPAMLAETLSDAQVQHLVGLTPNTSGLQIVFASKDVVQDVERTIAIQRIVDPGFRSNSFENRFTLMRLYHSQGRLAESLQVGKEICASELPIGQGVTETSWVLRQLGRSQEALELLDQALLEKSVSNRPELLVERARVLFALGRLPEAETQIDAYDQEFDDKQRYRLFGAARLMKGALRRIAGDEPAAQQSFAAGRWTPTRGDLGNGFDVFYAFALEAAANSGTNEQLEAILTAALRGNRVDTQSTGMLLANNISLPVAAARPAMQTDRGRELLLDIAFHRRGFRDLMVHFVTVVGHQVMLQSCSGSYVDDDYLVIDDFVKHFFEDMANRDSAAAMLVGGAIAMAWKGLSPDLALNLTGKEARPSLAFLLSLKYQSREWKDYKRLWKLAGEAPPDSPARQRHDSRQSP